METNQKNKQKIIILATVLVIMLILLVFLGIQFFQMRNELSGVKQELQQIKENLLLKDSAGTVQGTVTSGDSMESIEQAVSNAIVSEPPIPDSVPEPEAKHKVYLTFDDGPSKQTDKVLDILDEYGVKATFFVVGRDGEEAKERLKKIYERGHTIGMHSFSHDYTDIYESVDAFRADFLKSKEFIFDAIGVESKFYRFPGGSSNTLSKLNMSVFVDFLQKQGVEYYDWNISSGDGGGNLMPVDMILENCVKHISRYETSIILMHDSANKTTTVEALPELLEQILAMEDTVILPITENSKPIHHTIKVKEEMTANLKEETTERKETDGTDEKEVKEITGEENETLKAKKTTPEVSKEVIEDDTIEGQKIDSAEENIQ